MKVAIPLFEREVTRRMTGEMDFLMALIFDGTVDERVVTHINRDSSVHLAEQLIAEEVDVVVCDGVASADKALLKRNGIQVISGVIGAAGAALMKLARGRLRPGQYVWSDRSAFER